MPESRFCKALESDRQDAHLTTTMRVHHLLGLFRLTLTPRRTVPYSRAIKITLGHIRSKKLGNLLSTSRIELFRLPCMHSKAILLDTTYYSSRIIANMLYHQVYC